MEGINKLTRRKFVTTSLTALGASSLLMIPGVTYSGNYQTEKYPSGITVQEVIDLILKSIPNAPFKETVDTIKSGKGDQLVTGIVTTMFATAAVIQKAIDLKANFIIAHEPTFYNHTDDTSWLEQHAVYKFKKNLLSKNNIAVWRFHDYLHSHRPDGVQVGLIKALGWDQYYNAENPRLIKLPPTSLQDIISHLKKKLSIKTLRFMGDPNQICQRIGIVPGAMGGQGQIEFIHNEKPDVLICGELREWETSEYVRDAIAMNSKQSLVVLGHSVSEEPGMQWLQEWLQPQLPNIEITHLPSENPFSWM